jgi:hypothetical protein
MQLKKNGKIIGLVRESIKTGDEIGRRAGQVCKSMEEVA